jgi:hypothetical protein
MAGVHPQRDAEDCDNNHQDGAIEHGQRQPWMPTFSHLMQPCRCPLSQIRLV